MNYLLRAAIAATIVVKPDEKPAVTAPAPKLSDFRVIPVKPGHPREPRPQRFELDQEQGIVYVREADWPKLKAALDKQRTEASLEHVRDEMEKLE